MLKILQNKYLSLTARLILGGVFLFFAIGKIAEPSAFSKEISNYHILPVVFVNIGALILPWTELICGVMLLAGIKLRASSAVTGIMLIVFIAAIISAIARDLNINCGCSTAIVEPVGIRKIAEDTGLLILSLYIFFFHSPSFSIAKGADDEPLPECN